jgi:hypothetical protein
MNRQSIATQSVGATSRSTRRTVGGPLIEFRASEPGHNERSRTIEAPLPPAEPSGDVAVAQAQGAIKRTDGAPPAIDRAASSNRYRLVQSCLDCIFLR